MDITSPFFVVPVIVAVFRLLHPLRHQQQRRRARGALIHRDLEPHAPRRPVVAIDSSIAAVPSFTAIAWSRTVCSSCPAFSNCFTCSAFGCAGLPICCHTR